MYVLIICGASLHSGHAVQLKKKKASPYTKCVRVTKSVFIASLHAKVFLNVRPYLIAESQK